LKELARCLEGRKGLEIERAFITIMFHLYQTHYILSERAYHEIALRPITTVTGCTMVWVGSPAPYSIGRVVSKHR
jgi:hypothetical protein